MDLRTVAIKPETRNVEIDKSGWALICVDDAMCHYVDPDNLLAAKIDLPQAI